MPKTIDTNATIAPLIVPPQTSLAPMPWAGRLVGTRSKTALSRSEKGMELTIETGDRAALVTAIAHKARVCDGDSFRRRAIGVYGAIRRAVDLSPHRHIVRMWNHIPGIHDPLDSACDRYMHFNAGRFAAMCEWFDG